MLRLSTREEFSDIYKNPKKREALIESIMLKIWQDDCVCAGHPVYDDLSLLGDNGMSLECHPYYRYAESAIKALCVD